MIKKYLLSFLSIDYYAVLMVPTILLFVIMFIYTKTQTEVLRYLIIAIAFFLLAVLVFYNLQKYRIRKRLKSVEDVDAYDNGVFLGRNFLLENRMLAYQQKQVDEYFYKTLKQVTYQVGKKGQDLLVCTFENGMVIIPTGSRAQAERTCAFLKAQNDAVVFEGITPNGSGTLHSIDRTETSNE